MNPAIVAPDGFDIIDMTAGGQINSDQRRNLGTVAKVLQHAASNKLFEGENEHLASTNNYLSDTYQKFRWEEWILLEKFVSFSNVCSCSELELGDRSLRWLPALLLWVALGVKEARGTSGLGHSCLVRPIPPPEPLSHLIIPVCVVSAVDRMKHSVLVVRYSLQYLELNIKIADFCVFELKGFVCFLELRQSGETCLPISNNK